MQFLKEQLVPVADVLEDQEKRLRGWRNAYQAYQARLAIFYSEQKELKEQIKRQQEYRRELCRQQEDLARYKCELVQKQILHGRRPISFP